MYAPPLNVDIVALIGQEHDLSSNNLQIVVDTSDVPISKQLK